MYLRTGIRQHVYDAHCFTTRRTEKMAQMMWAANDDPISLFSKTGNRHDPARGLIKIPRTPFCIRISPCRIQSR
jgi:hypothetical protein